MFTLAQLRRRFAGGAIVTVAVAAFVPAAAFARTAHHDDGGPRLLARSLLSADHQAPGPPSGALSTPANGRQGPFPGSGDPRLLRSN